MASKGIRFTVWESDDGHGGKFYFHTILGNNKIVEPSQGYSAVRSVFDTINAIWHDTAVAQGNQSLILPSNIKMNRAWAIKRFIGICPVPYTKDSLKPK